MIGRIINIAFFLSVLQTSFSQDTVWVKDCGLLPNSRINAIPIVKQALALCKNKEKPVLVFEKGRYDFWPQHSMGKLYYESNTEFIPIRNCAILIENMNGLLVDGQGSDFVFHGRMQPFTIDKSQNITIKNVNVDWDVPLTAQAKIKNVTSQYIDLQINTGESPYTIENGKIVFVGEGWKSSLWGAMEYEEQSKRIVPQTGDAGCLGAGWRSGYVASEISTGLVRLTYPFKRLPKTGNYVGLRHSARDHAGTFIVDSKDVALQNFNLHHTAGLGILSQYAENLSFKNVKCVPSVNTNRVFSGHDDGMHFSNCRGQIVIDSCWFMGLMDDPINIHGTSVRISEKINDNKLICEFIEGMSFGFVWARANETIGFLNKETLNTLGKATVESFKTIDPKKFEIVFATSIPPDIKIGDALENLSWTPDATISNSFFGSNRARGILVSTPGKVVIENNIFETSGSAILIAGDANQWYESGAVKDVTIRGNRFNDPCLTSLYQFCEGIISIFPEIPQPDIEKPFHRNIRIEGNTFNPFDYPVLYAKSTEGLHFVNNRIVRSSRFKPFHKRKCMISLEYCRKVEISKNKLEGDVLGRNIQLISTPSKEVKLVDQKGIKIDKPSKGSGKST